MWPDKGAQLSDTVAFARVAWRSSPPQPKQFGRPSSLEDVTGQLFETQRDWPGFRDHFRAELSRDHWAKKDTLASLKLAGGTRDTEHPVVSRRSDILLPLCTGETSNVPTALKTARNKKTDSSRRPPIKVPHWFSCLD